MLSMLNNFSADEILKYFSYFSEEIGFDISCKLSPKLCKIVSSNFLRKIRKII